jgi:putative transposase
MAEEMLAARGVVASHEAVRPWALKVGQEFVNRIRRGLPVPEASATVMRSSSRPAG